jgi:hypothetical protein
VNGKPIEDDTIYKGAASSYYFGQDVKKYAINPVDTMRKRLDVLAEYIKKNSPISPTADGRIKLL